MEFLRNYRYYSDQQVTLFYGDALDVARHMADGAVDCIVTSPPYFGLRDYGTPGQYGLESSPAQYVETMRGLFAELRRVLADDGTLWLNIGDSYASGEVGRHDYADNTKIAAKAQEGRKYATLATGLPKKNLLGIPWRTAFALQDDGWILRNAIVWNKPNAMPESVTDRLSGRYEMVFMFSKQQRYWFDLDPIREPLAEGQAPRKLSRAGVFARSGDAANQPHRGFTKNGHDAGRNPGDVWTINTQPFSAAHFAVFPVALPTRCILAGCKPGGTVLDPFSGSWTTGLAAQRTGRKYIGIDLNKEYLDLSLRTRLNQSALDFDEVAQ